MSEQTAIPVEPSPICERCRVSPAVHTHHRKRRSQGGDDSPENVVRVCAPCHLWIHDNPRDAAAAGWLVLSWQESADIKAVPATGREHDHLSPGEMCPVCKRRVPKPKDESAEPRPRVTITMKVPVDEQEDGAALWSERIELGRELLCPVMGWERNVPAYFVALALVDKGLEIAREDVRQQGLADG